MTKDELKAMQAKIEKFEKLDRAMNNLSTAHKQLSGKKVEQVLMDFKGNNIKYRESDQRDEEVRMNVCWASSEEGLMEEVKAAILKILLDRASKYELERDAL